MAGDKDKVGGEKDKKKGKAKAKTKSKRAMAIHFTDGSKLRMTFPQQEGPAISSRVQEAMLADKITLEAEGALFVVPMANVKYVQVYPAPDELPPNVIRGAKIKG